MINLLSICLDAYRGLFQVGDFSTTTLALVFLLFAIEILEFIKGV